MSTNPVRPGDSGGPLLDRAGRVIGVVSAGTVIYPGRDVLTEEVSIATDPRPALGQMLLVKRPRRLRSLWRDPAVAAQPYARAMRLSSLLAIRGPQTPQVEEVLAQLQDAVNEAPYDAGLLFMQGSVYQMLGTSEAAAEAYRAALAVFDGHFPASYMLGLYHLQRHDYREALAQFAHTRRHRPYRHLAAYGLAQALMRRLQYREAEAELRRVLRYDPDFAPALFALAYCHLGQEDRPRAEQVAVKLAEQHPRWAAQLHQVLAYPIFLPTVLRPLPPAPFRTAAPAPLP